jgi:Zn finger protein HypA/HybF involved in hydrogenase expression
MLTLPFQYRAHADKDVWCQACGAHKEPLPSGEMYCPSCHPSATLGNELDESELTIFNDEPEEA